LQLLKAEAAQEQQAQAAKLAQMKADAADRMAAMQSEAVQTAGEVRAFLNPVLCLCVCCVYERRQRESTPVCSFFRPSCAQKTSLTNESEGSFPSNRRISAHVRVVVLGVQRRAVFWAEQHGSFVGAPALQACAPRNGSHQHRRAAEWGVVHVAAQRGSGSVFLFSVVSVGGCLSLVGL